jgi:hypothetical protein
MAVPQEKSKRAGLRDQRYIWEFGVKRKVPASEGGRYKKLWESGDSYEEYVQRGGGAGGWEGDRV